MKKKTNYNDLSPNYDLRYKVNPMDGISKALLNIISENNFKNILEVGCGTGHWLKKLDHSLNKFGVDFSTGMFKEAQRNINRINLILADANSLPFASGNFDLIYCVNAIHQFENKSEFIRDSFWLLKPNGVLTIIGLDPRNENDKWYIYDFFDGTLEKDLKRFSSINEIELWMEESGLQNVNKNIVESVINDMTGKEVFNDTFLLKDQSSQLASLSNQEYTAGINRIKNAVENNPKMIFPVRLSFISVSGKKLKLV